MMLATTKRCRHCRKAPVSRPRGLCFRCYYRPGVKKMFPPLLQARFVSKLADFSGLGKLPPCPTSAAPGTPEKVAVLAQRAQAGCRLFHPEDGVCR